MSYYRLPDPDFNKQDPDELRKKYRGLRNELKKHLHNIAVHKQVYGERQVISPLLVKHIERLEYKIAQCHMTAHFWSINLEIEDEQ